MRVNVGDVVRINEYRRFDGTIDTKAMFVVLRHGCYDHPGNDNFLAIKVSSNPGLFQVQLLKTYTPFLDNDVSYLNCSNIHTFRESEVRSIIGRLNPYYMNKMAQQFLNCANGVIGQISDMIGEENLFDFEKVVVFNKDKSNVR
jgi:hypothetical protein